MVWIGLALIALSMFMRLAGVTVLRTVCANHWDELFDPIPGRAAAPVAVAPLFPGIGPADFDDLVKAERSVLRRLPNHIAGPMWWRVGLRNYSRALFWIGMFSLISSVIR
jgi:hypothetical protein